MRHHHHLQLTSLLLASSALIASPASGQQAQAAPPVEEAPAQHVDEHTHHHGGEEIVIIMPGVDTADALLIAERIRATVDVEIFHLNRDIGNVTISIGVASARGRAADFGTMFREADNALYLAKQHGRNRVEFATQNPSIAA